MRSCTLVLAALLGCGSDGNPATPDAAPRPDAPPSCPPPTSPLQLGSHKLFLAFGGVTLALGACDDARTNCSSLVASASTPVPAFTATTRIAPITAMVQEALAPFSVDVATTRPASGNYWMITVGGTPALVTTTVDARVAMKPVCDATNRNSIALVFEDDDVDVTDRAYANAIASAFGRLAGLVPTARSGDCMCTASTCTHTQACTWGTTTLPESGNHCMRSSQNEQLLLMQAVGCR